MVLRYRSAANGYSAAERAAIILQRIRDFDADLLTKPVRSGSINGASVVMIGEKLLITITQADYQANNTTGPGLAKVWTENLKAALHNTQMRYLRKTKWSPHGSSLDQRTGNAGARQ